MKEATEKASDYLSKNPNSYISILDEKYGDEYDLDGNLKDETYSKGGTIIHKSDKYDSEYWVDNDGDLFYRPITTDGSVEEWSGVSEEAFSEKERKEFDKEMKKLFGKKINFKKGGKIKDGYIRKDRFTKLQRELKKSNSKLNKTQGREKSLKKDLKQNRSRLWC